jgi:hypothetical protein
LRSVTEAAAVTAEEAAAVTEENLGAVTGMGVLDLATRVDFFRFFALF